MPEQSTTLRDMIQEAQKRGLSLRDLQARAIDPRTGNTVGKDLIGQLRRGEVNRIPTAEQLRALAVALNLPYERVRQAAIAQWLPSSEEEDAERERLQLLAEAYELRDRAAATIARLEQQEQQDEDGGRRAG